MEIFKQIAPLQAYLSNQKQSGNKIGLVPTMGALHDGHLTLVKASKEQHCITVCSIFVNPTQFNNPEDLKKYPRSLDKDIELLQKVECDVLFCPDEAEIYPIATALSFDFGDLERVMEGKFRPGHFSGVGIVVSKLFNIVQPDHAFFGQKDWQQFAIVKRLVSDLSFSLTLHSVEIARERDGLAMSSRNQRLSVSERKNAVAFYTALSLAKQAHKQGKSVQELNAIVEQCIGEFPSIQLEYFEVADRSNLSSLNLVTDPSQAIMCIAGYAGEVRLIDNMFLD